MKITKRLTALLLTAAMLLSIVCVPVGAITVAEMPDYSEEHWAAEALAWAVENNLIKGYDDGTIRADACLTRAEMATVINRAFGASILASIENFTDVSADDWFYEEIAKAVNMGTFEGSDEGYIRPEDNILREEAFVVIARALVLSGADISLLEKFGDFEKVSDWADNLLADLTEREYINGSPVEGAEKNNLYPRECITRAEFAQLLYNIFDRIMGDAAIEDVEIEGNLLVNCLSDLTMKDVTVNGDLIIADSVGLKSVNLTDVKITGRLVIRGGKDIKLTNVTTGGGVVVRNNNTTVNFDNYKSEKVFEGFIAKTPAKFKTPSSSGSIVVGPSESYATWTAEYYTENLDGTFSLKETDTYRNTEGTRVNASSIAKTYTGFTYDADNVNGVPSGTVAEGLVLKLYYTRNEYTVTFEDAGNFMVGELGEKKVRYEDTLDEEDFLWAERAGFAATYLGEDFSHKVANDAWVLSTDTATEFTSATPVTGDITVWPKWGEIIAGVYVESVDLRQPLRGIYYNSDTRAIDTVKDFIFLKENAIMFAINDKNLDDKLIGKADFILDADRNIKLIEHEICIVETLGAGNLEKDISDALKSDGFTADEQIIGDVVHELFTDKKITVTYDNVSVIEQYGKKVEGITYENVKDDIPNSYRQIMTEDEIKKAFDEAKEQYSNEVYLTLIQFHDEHPETEAPDWLKDWYNAYIGANGPVASVYAMGTHTVESTVVVKINLVSGIIIPKYNQAINKFKSKFAGKYEDNDYFMRLIEIINPDYLLDGSNEDQDNDAMLSGYKLKDNQFYYDVIKEAAVMADEAGKWFKENKGDEELQNMADELGELVSDYMTKINNLLDKYVEKAVNKLYDLTNKEKIELIEKYKDRRLTQEDIDKATDILKQAITGYDITTESAYDKAYNFDNDTLNDTKFDESNIPASLVGSGMIDGFYKEIRGNEAWLGRGEYISGK